MHSKYYEKPLPSKIIASIRVYEKPLPSKIVAAIKVYEKPFPFKTLPFNSLRSPYSFNNTATIPTLFNRKGGAVCQL